ncbi:MAG TPA: glycosyltransferase family 39 protein, partial [Ktedonobacteraceae bacterium]|nr:glycosyltransferase family 39 protein [Ktedonobacteraceae bacterium]
MKKIWSDCKSMDLSLTATEETSNPKDTTRYKLRSWLSTWEVYPIILIAGFLRLYGLNTTSIAADQGALLLLAYSAVHHSLIPISSNSASIFILHQPAAIYFLMLPALFSPNPLWAVVMTALFNIIAVLIAYIFTRRYFGRFAATIASLLFATAETAIVFSRFIWQPTLLAPFVMLFFFALFWGVVDRRKGWLFPALLLLGICYQLHEITLILAVPLLLALLLAPQTIRLLDIVLGGIALMLIFAPYLVWEFSSKFADIHTVLNLTHAHAQIDTKALTYYQRFLNAYYYDDRFVGSSFYDPIGSTASLVFKILPTLVLTRLVLLLLLLVSLATVGILVIQPQHSGGQNSTENGTTKKPGSRLFTHLFKWWKGLRADPFRCGLIILLAWQIVPLVILSRHTATMHLHYLLMLLPGPFILIGFFIGRLLAWLQEWKSTRIVQGLRYGTYTLTSFVLIIQLVGSTASLIDIMHGINNHIFGYNDLGSLQSALHEADQVAQQHRLNRVYITVSTSGYDSTSTSLPFLAQQMHTPSTLFDAASCLVLPTPGEGPAVLLIKSSNSMALTLLSRFATTTLIDRPPLLGTSPFQLYIVTPRLQSSSINSGFIDYLRPAMQAQQVTIDNSSFLLTSWTMLNNEQPSSFTSYTYILRAKPDLPGTLAIRSDCLLTSIHAGDQLVTAFRLPKVSPTVPSFEVTSQFLTVAPHTITMG